MPAPRLAAQEQAPRPARSAVRFFQCNPAGEAIELLNKGRPIMQEMIAEGKLLDYGILRHAWGDEWNVVDYIVLAEGQDLDAVAAEAFRRYRERFPEEVESGRFSELCTAHKDNIYSVVPPAEGD